MARIGLTLWFTVTTLLGPGLCCCSVVGFAPRAAAAAPSATTEPRRTCPHCEPGPGDALADQAPAEPSPQAPCPCREGKTGSPAVLADPTPVERFPHRAGVDNAPPALWPVPADSPVAAGAPSDSDHTTGPPRTGRDILRALHVLRC